LQSAFFIALTVPTNVSVGTSISSLLLAPKTFIQIVRPIVPLRTAIIFLALVKLSNFDSNSLINLPAVET